MKIELKLVENRNFTQECLVCGRKEDKFYEYHSGYYQGEDMQIDPESAYCKTCGFNWQQSEPNFVNRIYQEAKEYLKSPIIKLNK